MLLKIRIKVGLILFILSFELMATPYPCSGYPGNYYVNPDGSEGGFVAASAKVDETVTISPKASVCERATVSNGAFISDQARVGGNAIVTGKVLVNGKARVYGEAYLVNLHGGPLLVTDEAQVFGHAYLNGSVVVSDTAQIYGEGKVIEFAQVMGNSKVCGRSLVSGFEILVDDPSRCP